LKTLADLVSFWNKNLIEILCIYIQLWSGLFAQILQITGIFEDWRLIVWIF
jgi:hypothetical protein